MAQSIARLEVTRNETSSHSWVCLDNTSEQDKGNKYVMISGTPNMTFKVNITFITNELALGNTTSFRGLQIFKFWPGKQRLGKDAQLDITVQSETNSKGTLTVSHYCSQTEKRDKFIINHLEPSIFLSFSKKGRITLSQVSNPKFSTRNLKTPYFISVLPEDLNDPKPVNIKLELSFDYDYSGPICFIIFVPFLGGIIISFWALKCFKEPLTLVSSNSSGSSLRSESGNGASVSFQSGKLFSCCGDSEDSELRPLLSREVQTPSTYAQLLRAMLTVMRYHWVGKGRKTFSYITCIVGFVLIIGAFQFVYVNWSIMVSNGNRDKCFYNDLCYRVSVNDIPFNLMISNLSYMIHGIVLAWSIWVMEAELYIQARKKAVAEYRKPPKKPEQGEQLPRHTLICSNLHVHLPELSVPEFTCHDEDKILTIFTRAYKKKYSFSIGYAFAWALIFEGLFSLTYHLCPSRLTFQFDSAFMFVIAGLIVVSLFNGLSEQECQKEMGDPRPIEDTTFFLFIIVPLYILNYLGSLYDKYDDGKSLPLSVYVIFCVGMVLWYILTFFWSCNKLFHSSIKNGFHTFESKVKAALFALTVLTNCVILPSFLHKDISHLLLFSTITAALASSIGKVTIKAYKATKGSNYLSFSTIVLRVCQGSYIIFAIAIMSVAIYVFQYIPTSEKTAPPEISRNKNKECVLLHFYDDHDVWHILSSFGLLMGAYLVMYISE